MSASSTVAHPRPPGLEARLPVRRERGHDPAPQPVAAPAQHRRHRRRGAPRRRRRGARPAASRRPAASSSSKRVSGERGRGVRKSGVQSCSLVSASSSSPSSPARAASVRWSHGQHQRVATRLAPGPQRQRELVHRREREPDLAEVGPGQLVLDQPDHEAIRYIVGAPPGGRDRTLPCSAASCSPTDPVERALTLATISASLSTGLFYSVSALYFTRVIGLEATTVGVGLTIAGAVGRGGVVRGRVRRRPGRRGPAPAVGERRAGPGAAGLRRRRRRGLVHAGRLRRGRRPQPPGHREGDPPGALVHRRRSGSRSGPGCG